MLAWLWKRLSENGPQVSISGRGLRRFPERECNRLLRARVLIEHGRADSWSVCAHCDCGLDARPIRRIGEELRACCPHDAAEDLVLDEADLRRFGIDADRLAGQIAASGELAGGVIRIADGLWSLGNGSSGTAVMLSSAPDMLEAPGMILAIKAVANPRPATIVLFQPDTAMSLRLCEAGMRILSLADAFHTGADGRDRFAAERAPVPVASVRLIMRRGAQMAILDGRSLELPPQMFVLLRMLVEQALERDSVLKAQTIEEQLGREPREIVRDLRRALVNCGLDDAAAESLIRTVRGRGYRLGLDPAEVAIEV